MALITAKDVAALRKLTGLGMMEAKKALTEAEGVMDKAVKLVREQGLAKMDTRTDRESAEGRVAAVVNDDRTKGAIVQVNTETDFTANNDSFVEMTRKVAAEALSQDPGQVEVTDAIKAAVDDVRLTTKENVQFAKGQVFGGGGTTVGSYVHHNGKVGVLVEVEGDASEQALKELSMHISAVSPSPLGVNEEDVPADAVESEREIALKQAMDSGKPQEIAEKMVEGKMRKYLDSVVLLRQPWVMDDKQQVKDALPAGVTVKRFARFQLG